MLISKEDLIKELKEIVLPLIKKAGKRRNDLIHAYWGINDDKYPDALIRISSSEPWMVYKASDFNEAIDLIIAASNAIIKFELKVTKFLKRKKRPR